MAAAEVSAPTPEEARPGRGSWPGPVLAGAVMTLALLALHGQLTSLVVSSTRYFMAVGLIECGAASLRDLAVGQCPYLGDGTGSIANGVGFVALGTGFVRVLGVSAAWGYVLASTVLMAAAVAGTYLLARRLGVGRVLALAVTFLYLASPSLISMHGLGTTFWGLALVPAGVEVALRAGDAMRGSWWARVGWFAGWVGATTFLLFLDGYGYVMTQVATGILTLPSLWRSPRGWRNLLPFVGLAVVNVVAYLTHRQVVPTGSWDTSPIDLFRAMGADLLTFLVPTDETWWVWFASPVDPDVLWGDRTNSVGNYLGLGLLVLAVAGAWLARRERRAVVWTMVGLVAVAGLLALGPSLKFGEVRGLLVPPIPYSSYLMPEADAVLGLPTTWLYENVPGFAMMRATYRWVVLVRLGMLVLAALGVQALLARRRPAGRWAVAVLCAVAVLEVSPDVGGMTDLGRRNAATVRQFDADVLDPMRAAVPEGTRVVFAPGAIGGNDYLANYLAPMMGVRAHNIGGDKALAEVRRTRPEAVTALLAAEPEDFVEAAVLVLHGGDADAIVVPYFDLRWSADRWPTSAQWTERGRAATAQVRTAGDPRLAIEEHDHFAVLTRAP